MKIIPICNCFCRLILIPWGQWLGLRKSNKTFANLPHHDELEKAYRKTRTRLPHREIEALAKRTDMEVRQIERWMRKRMAKDKHTTLAKFSECGYEVLFLLVLKYEHAFY